MEKTSSKLICRYCGGVNPRQSKTCFHCDRTIKTSGANSFLKDVPDQLYETNQELFWNSETQQFQTKSLQKIALNNTKENLESTVPSSFEKCDVCRSNCSIETGCLRFGNKTLKVSLKAEQSSSSYLFDMTDSKKIILGRSITPWDEVLDLSISKIHCVIKYENLQYMIQEENPSTNGTYVNSLRLVNQQPVVLKSGDIITLGNKRFVFHVN